MSLNVGTMEGRIPFDLELKNGDDDKRAFLGFAVSVKRNYKPEGEQYYPEDLLYCKSFGAQAKFISKYFGKGDGITLQYELRKDDDYEKDGATVKGNMYCHITNVFFPEGKGKKEEGESKPAASNKPSSGKSNPLAKTGSTPNPLAKKPGSGKIPF